MRIDKELLKGCIPIMVLSLFEQEDLYGYQIIKNLESLSNSTFMLKDGTLYPILHSLEKSGYIESYWQSSETGRKRRYYKITLEGREYLAEKIAQWNYLVQSVGLVINGGTENES